MRGTNIDDGSDRGRGTEREIFNQAKYVVQSGPVKDLSEDRSEPMVFINPEFEILTDEMGQYQEGCLSVPGYYENVDRPQRVKIKALDRDGKPFEMIAEGLLAGCSVTTGMTSIARASC